MGIKLIRSEINMLTLFAHNPIWGSSPSKPTSKTLINSQIAKIRTLFGLQNRKTI